MIVFDWDGTLVDTMPSLRASAVDLISQPRSIGLRYAGEVYDGTIGSSFPEQLEEIFPGDPDNERVAAHFAASQRAVYQHASLFPNVVPWLEELDRYGICTSSPRADVMKSPAYEIVSAPQSFWNITGREYGPKQEQLANWKHFFPELTFIGDALRDWKYASALKLKFVAVETSFPSAVWRQLGVPSHLSLTGAISAACSGAVWKP